MTATVLPHRYAMVPTASLVPSPDNPNHGDVDGITESIEGVGFYGVVLVHEATGRILAGEHRWRAAQAAGLPELPAVVIDCDEDTARAIMLGDNEWARRGVWDQAKLVALLQQQQATALGLIGTGFTDAALARLVAAGPGAQGGPAPTLADRFLAPPFDVLDGRAGWWRERKARWVALGLESEVGRLDEAGARAVGALRADPAFYAKKAEAEAALGHVMTTAEFTARWYEPPEQGVASGKSIFDPVLCELVYRWFCPPGGVVLDPFAGGSVRGLVAGMLGHAYYGCDLSAGQVAANEQQAAAFAERGLVGGRAGQAAGGSVGPGEVTPVQEHGGHLVKRDDLFAVGGSAGGKARTCLALATAAEPAGLTTAGSRQSPQANIVAAVAAALGVPCRVHVPAAAGGLTPELAAAAGHGAEIVEHRPGHNSVIIARARDDALARGWLSVPFGMECAEAVTQTASQVASLPEDVARIVVPVGSGMSLAGVLSGLASAGRDTPVLGVVVGAAPEKRLDRWSPGWRRRCKLVQAAERYHDHAAATALGGLELDPVYEAKCLPHLRPGDLLWVVGRRETATAAPAGGPVPSWANADAAAWVRALAPDSADLVFTCPPYYGLERYSDDPADLSAMDPAAFDTAYAAILAGAARALRPDRFAVVVTGDVREPGTGLLRDLRGVTVAAAEAAGLGYCSGAVLLTTVGSARLAAARVFGGTRTLLRTHQDVLVFAKGGRAAAARACGPVVVELPPEAA